VGVAFALMLESGGDEPSPPPPDEPSPAGIRPSQPAEEGIWLSSAEIHRLPMSGPAWENVKREADRPLPPAQVSDQNSVHDTSTLAVALVAARTNDPAYRQKAADAISAAIGTENTPSRAGSRHLPICRNATAYVIAADVIDLHGYSDHQDERFRTWIARLRDHSYGGEEAARLIHEQRPNNHGTMCGAARAAISRYLGDQSELARTAQVMRGWLGDRQSFEFRDYPSDSDTYMPDPSKPRPVNPPGASKDGHDVDGLLPAEHARCGTFSWPPCYTIYPWGGLAGAVVTAEILRRAGYARVFEWEHRALLRAYTRLHELSRLDPVWWTEATTGDDNWQPWLVNHVYGTDFPAVTPTEPGRNMGWTDWTHGSKGAADRDPDAGGATKRRQGALRAPRRMRLGARSRRAHRRQSYEGPASAGPSAPATGVSL
jgi:Alginate lyase